MKPGMIDPSDPGRYRPLLVVLLVTLVAWILVGLAWPRVVLGYFVFSFAAIVIFLVVDWLRRRTR